MEWLGKIPNHWRVMPVKYLAVLNPRKSAINPTLLNQECSFLPMEKLKLNSIVLDERRVVSDVYDGYTYFENGDVLMAKVTPCFENKNIAVASGLLNGVGFGSSEIYVLRSNDRIDNRFLFYRLQEDSFMDVATAAMAGAGGLKRVPSEVVNGYRLGVPEVDEQARIAAFLDYETARIDSLIDKQQRLIELLKEKRQAVISHAVTKGLNPDVRMKDSGVEWLGQVPEHWEVTRLKYVGYAKNGLTYSPDDVASEDDGVLVLRSSNIQNAKLSFTDNVYVNMDIPERIRTQKNDLLICSRNGSRNLIGKNALITEEAIGMAFGAFMVLYRSNLNSYLYWVLNSPLFEYQSGSFLTSTINQLTIGNLGSMEVPLPPHEEQWLIEKYLKEKNSYFERLIQISNRKVELLQERRTALISAAVTGKIDLRGWTPPVKEDAA
ncbi:restriction endonuclease subunit S [Shewanella chilikensis]|uniref:restriction endonuclease subunit S n=1 Tax=Shewanella chilikensis TaxID=558541 RepID=UPI00399B35B7